VERILIIEDDADIAELVRIHLSDMGFSVARSADGREGLDMATNGDYALIVLDIMLPGIDGFEVCRSLRNNGNQTPILMLTARTEEIDKVVGLEIGADDYLTKPFSIRELTARVKAILRRSTLSNQAPEEAQGKQIEAEDFFLDIDKRIVKIKGEVKELSPKEFDLLVLMASNSGRTYSRQQLLSLVWGYEFDGFEHTVNSHINRLRSKIEVNVQSPEFVLTTWGVGYRFKDLET
jgi:two-component system alkaline phosphatase synthesis response regulator PhoP